MKLAGRMWYGSGKRPLHFSVDHFVFFQFLNILLK